ncbi:hypothetical protein N0V84_009497 [Fusarium piperis]|uniref:Heterokaryon incompatibility domain-containing protein n=1 Tax=Fusarium piperis TaxID=1435070 RepID=A0A9W8W667_9HYPO|nr:hypothetical protein N0V84_009497 [Fusarium piperis]
MTASQWFTRGWTLQELIAPQTVHFYNQKWVYLGSRDVVAEAIELATAIPARALHGKGLLGISTYQRMQWASTRTTTRPEDMAYCLLGIFDVNIPLLYGEGKKQALQRLQEEIIRKSTDLSLFLWTAPREEDQGPDLEFRGLLAEDPSWFTSPRSDGFHGFDELFRKNDSGIVPLQDTAIAITNKGTSVRWTIMPVPTDPAGTLHLAMLAESGDVVGGILIQQLDQDATEFCRVLSDKLIWIDRRGDTTKVWNHDLLGSPDDLLRVSLDSGPRSFYVRAHFDLSNEPSYSGVGFSFTRHKILEGPLESFWADIVGSSPEFRQDSDSESPTWVARFRLERDSEFFRTPWEMRKSKVLGALVTSITARSNRGMRKPIGDRCVVVGVDVLPQTAIGTMNTFLEPWIVNTNEITPEDAIRKLGSCAEPSKWRDYDIGKRIWGRERRCSLRKLTRVSGLWSDIRITISG